MSAPMSHDSDKLQGALNELVSAMSALNMHPDPIPNATGYLSETDAWAKHAMEHLHAVFELLNKAHQERELLKTKIYRLEVKQIEKEKTLLESMKIVQAVDIIREILWLDADEEGGFSMNPEKEWDAETIERVAEALTDRGLGPKKAESAMEKTAMAILDEAASKTGWNEQSKLELICEYINNQQDNTTFEDFVQRHVQEEMNSE